MRTRRNFIGWGIFLICLGAIPLAVQLGVIDREAANQLLRLWPLILIGIGVGLMLRFTRFEMLGGVIVAGTFGILLGVVLAGGFPGAAATCNSGQTGAPLATQSGSFDGSSGSIQFELTCAEVDINRATGGAWRVDVAADGSPTVEGDASVLRLKSPDRTGFLPFTGGRHERWDITLPSEQSLSGSITLNASTADIALGNGGLTSLSTTFNASDASVDLTSETASSTQTTFESTLNASTVRLSVPNAMMTGGLTLNAATLQLCSPPDAAIRIDYQDTLSSNNFAAVGLVQSGKTWQSPDYGSTANRIDLRITANVSTTTLSRSGGCQ
jgi:hypothetical protein